MESVLSCRYKQNLSSLEESLSFKSLSKNEFDFLDYFFATKSDFSETFLP